MPTITSPSTAEGTNIPNCGMAFNIAREVAELVDTPILTFPPPTTLAVGITVPLAIATISPSQRARGQGRYTCGCCGVTGVGSTYRETETRFR